MPSPVEYINKLWYIHIIDDLRGNNMVPFLKIGGDYTGLGSILPSEVFPTPLSLSLSRKKSEEDRCLEIRSLTHSVINKETREEDTCQVFQGLLLTPPPFCLSTFQGPPSSCLETILVHAPSKKPQVQRGWRMCTRARGGGSSSLQSVPSLGTASKANSYLYSIASSKIVPYKQ